MLVLGWRGSTIDYEIKSLKRLVVPPEKETLDRERVDMYSVLK
jgi:hypothetical protein